MIRVGVAALSSGSCSKRPADAPVQPVMAAPFDDVRSQADPPLHVVLSASRALSLCVQRTPEAAMCFEPSDSGALERTDVESHGWMVRVEPTPAYVDGTHLVELPMAEASPVHALPFAAIDAAALTLGVLCVQGQGGEVACNSFEKPDVYRTVMRGGERLVAAEIRATDRTLLAIDADARLWCTGRACKALALEHDAPADTDRGMTTTPDGESLASGTAWPVAPDVDDAVPIAASVRRVRTDGLSTVCIEDGTRHVVCHAPHMPPTPSMDASSALDFATAGNDICMLEGPIPGARLECRHVDRDGRWTVVLDTQVSGARRLHARGTTLCVDVAGGLRCTRLLGKSQAHAPTDVIATSAR